MEWGLLFVNTFIAIYTKERKSGRRERSRSWNGRKTETETTKTAVKKAVNAVDPSEVDSLSIQKTNLPFKCNPTPVKNLNAKSELKAFRPQTFFTGDLYAELSLEVHRPKSSQLSITSDILVAQVEKILKIMESKHSPTILPQLWQPSTKSWPWTPHPNGLKHSQGWGPNQSV